MGIQTHRILYYIIAAFPQKSTTIRPSAKILCRPGRAGGSVAESHLRKLYRWHKTVEKKKGNNLLLLLFLKRKSLLSKNVIYEKIKAMFYAKDSTKLQNKNLLVFLRKNNNLGLHYLVICATISAQGGAYPVWHRCCPASSRLFAPFGGWRTGSLPRFLNGGMFTFPKGVERFGKDT